MPNKGIDIDFGVDAQARLPSGFLLVCSLGFHGFNSFLILLEIVLANRLFASWLVVLFVTTPLTIPLLFPISHLHPHIPLYLLLFSDYTRL